MKDLKFNCVRTHRGYWKKILKQDKLTKEDAIRFNNAVDVYLEKYPNWELTNKIK